MTTAARTFFSLQVNASGSWCKLLARVPGEREAEARAAALELRRIAPGLRFKIVDAEGRETATLGIRRGHDTWMDGEA